MTKASISLKKYLELTDLKITEILENTPIKPELIVPIDVPDGELHSWAVRTYTVSEQAATMGRVRAIANAYNPDGYRRGVRYVPQGTYKSLDWKGDIIMSNTPDEIEDHMELIKYVKDGPDGQTVLLNGLGLGVVLEMLKATNKVSKVIVNEISTDVIELTGKHYLAKYPGWVEINHTSAFTFKPPKGMRYDAVWHDIWPDITKDNLKDMKKLSYRYSKYTKWQGYWCKDQCILIGTHRTVVDKARRIRKA